MTQGTDRGLGAWEEGRSMTQGTDRGLGAWEEGRSKTQAQQTVRCHQQTVVDSDHEQAGDTQ